MEVRIYNESVWSNQWSLWAHHIGSLQGGGIPPHVPSASCSYTRKLLPGKEARPGRLALHQGPQPFLSALPLLIFSNQSWVLVPLTVACKTLLGTICKWFWNVEKMKQRHSKLHFSNFLVLGSLYCLKNYRGLQKLMFMLVICIILTSLTKILYI